MLLERKIGVATDVGEGHSDVLLLGRDLLASAFIGLPRLIELLLGGGTGSQQAFLPFELARALAALAEVDAEEIDESSPQLSFELAAQVELAPDAKQRLLELRSEAERLDLLVQLLDAVRAVLIATRAA